GAGSGVPLHPGHRADRQLRARELLARIGVVEAQHAQAAVVRDQRQRAAVARKRELLDVRTGRAESGEASRLQVEIRCAPELAVAVGREVEAAAIARKIEMLNANLGLPIRVQ